MHKRENGFDNDDVEVEPCRRPNFLVLCTEKFKNLRLQMGIVGRAGTQTQRELSHRRSEPRRVERSFEYLCIIREPVRQQLGLEVVCDLLPHSFIKNGQTWVGRDHRDFNTGNYAGTVGAPEVRISRDPVVEIE